MVKQVKVFYLEGYFWDSLVVKCVFIVVVEVCCEVGGKVVFFFFDGFCVDWYRVSFFELVNGYVDVLFVNDVEIQLFYEIDDFDQVFEWVCGCCLVIVIICGVKGFVVLSGDQCWDIGIFGLGDLVDIMGVGDFYVGGFLYGFIQGELLDCCGEFGVFCVGQIVI